MVLRIKHRALYMLDPVGLNQMSKHNENSGHTHSARPWLQAVSQNDKIMDWPGIKVGTCLSIKVLNFPNLRLLVSKLN